jgi:hypothetical protein
LVLLAVVLIVWLMMRNKPWTQKVYRVRERSEF